MEVRYPPQKGYLSDTCAIPHENKAKGCDAPLCDTISKRYCTIWGLLSLAPFDTDIGNFGMFLCTLLYIFEGALVGQT